MTTIVDAFKYEQALRAASVPDQQATAMAQALSDAIRIDELATKADLTELRLATKADLAELKASIVLWMVGSQTAMLAVLIGLMLKFAGH